jgi:DNA sulfur modification protein DndB
MTTKKTKTERRYYPSLRGTFGNWIYYSCLMPASDVTRRVRFADEIHPNKALSALIQRTLKKGRAKEIGDYLIRENQRFFNSMVVAVYDGEPVWHGFSNFRPQVNDIDLSDVPEDAEDSVGFLSFTGEEELFAIDGQHRLAGMKNAIERDADLILGDVSMLLVAHNNSKEGLTRTRQLFTTLNKTARAVGKGEIIALDENDTMAIVSRYLFDFDHNFSEKRIKFAQTDNVAATDSELTTIGNLYDVLSSIFSKYPVPKPKQDLRFIRPSDPEIEVYISTAQAFFANLAKQFPEFGGYFKSSTQRGRQIVQENRTATGGHILFRPVGLRIFAEVTSALLSRGLDMNGAGARLSLLPTDIDAAPYQGILWQNGRVLASGRVLARDILLYMLGIGNDAGSLKERLARAKGIQSSSVKLPARV